MRDRGLALPLLFAATGAFALASQTLLFREYLVAFGGDELGIAFFFGSWLGWIAIGALVANRLAGHLAVHRGFFALTLLYPFAFVGQLVLVVDIRPMWGVEPFELFPLGTLFAATALAVSPVSFLTGLLFQTGSAFAAEVRAGSAAPEVGAGQIAARLYAFEAFGGFAGGLAVTALLWKLVPPVRIASAVALALLVGAAYAAARLGARAAAAVAGALALCALVVSITPAGAALSNRLQALRWRATFPAARLVESRETPYQRVSVARLPGQTALLSNGSVLSTTADRADHAAAAALLFAEHPGTRRMLLVGLGAEGLVPHLLRYPLERLDVVVVDEIAHEIALRRLGAQVRRAFDDERVAFWIADPRAFVAKRGERGSRAYDLVLVAMPDPDTAYLNRYFTVDFYRSVRGALTKRGVLATRISAGENYAGTELARYGRSVFASLAAVFGEVVVTPGDRAWLFASPSRGQVTVDAAVLEGRLRGLARREASVPPEIFATLVPAERVPATRALFEDTGAEPPGSLENTDARPVALFNNLVVLAARSGPALVRPLRGLRLAGLPVLAWPLLLLLVLRLYYRSTTQGPHRAARFNGTALLVTFGAVSMCLCILLLVSFQNRFGHVFLSIGLLSALFMLGLGAGGLGGSRLVRRASGFPIWPAHVACLPVLALCLALPRLLGALASAPQAAALGAYHGLFLVTGVLCGAAFPVAGLALEATNRGAGWIAGTLESADHWGGALGAGFVGVLVVPVLGLSRASALLALAVGAAWLLFVAEAWGPLLGRPWRTGLDRLRRRHAGDRVRALGFVVAGIVLAVVVVGNLLSRALSLPRVRLDETWIAAHYGASRVRTESDPFVHHLAWTVESEEPRHVLVASRAIAPDVQGYGGPMNLLVVVGGDGTIEEVSLLESQETPAYIHGLDAWLREFRGRSVDAPFVVGDGGVDVMTGATVTSRAVGQILETSRARIGRDVLGRPRVAAARTTPVEWKAPGALYALVALVLSVPVFLKGGSTLRTAFLCANLLFGGFVLNLQLSAAHVARLFSGWLPSEHSAALFVLVVGVLVLAVAFGPIYCGTLCPFGAAQELLGRLGLVRGASPDGDRRARRVKYFVLAAVLVAYFATRSEDVFAFDPLQWAFGYRYEAAIAILFALVGAASLFYFRFWCRYLCPAGAFLSLFTGLGLALRFARPKPYARCDLGVQNHWQLDCLQCNRCITMQVKAGEIDTGEARVPSRPARWKDLALGLGVTLALAVSLFAVTAGAPLGGAAPDSLGGTRAVDAGEIRRQIGERRLSSKKALFYRPVREIEKEEAPAPSRGIPLR